jgi:prepilin-type N-terminal cleavage/methylation domain-containing protein
MKINREDRAAGFTLIELMIVVAIIGILAAIAIPKFADLINKSREGATKGSLATVRSALRVYYADTEGTYPSDNLACLTANAKYLNEIPTAKIPSTPHQVSNVVCTSMFNIPGGCMLGMGITASYDGQMGPLWIYWEQDQPLPMGTLRNKGDFWVGCNHSDSKGFGWSTF